MAPMDHDGLHKYVFSLRETQADLLRVAIPEWVEDLDLDAIDNVSSEFSDGDSRRSADMVLRCPFKEGRLADGTRAYALFLIEFQSRPHPRMAKRVREYTEMLLDRLRRDGVPRREGGPPPVQAIVLYNGGDDWRAPGAEGEARTAPTERAARALAPMQPQAYRLVDERMETAQHWPENNRVASLARLQFDASEPDVLERLRRELPRYPGEENRALRECFHAWARALWAEVAGADAPFPEFEALEEEFEGAGEMAMTAQAIHRRWVADLRAKGRAEGIAEGKAEGIAEGRVEGIVEGKRDAICRLARTRFGDRGLARLPALLAGVTEREDLDRVLDWAAECADAPQLLARVRGLGNGKG